MFGLLKFGDIYINLSKEGRNRVLGKIFGISDVSVTNVDIVSTGIIFKMFSNGVFYQYIFVLDKGKNNLIQDERVISYKIYLYNEKKVPVGDFIYQLVQCQDEYQVYSLIKKYL